MERMGRSEVRGRSQGGLGGGWAAGSGALGLMVPLAQVSFEQISRKQTHITQKSASVCWDSLSFFTPIINILASGSDEQGGRTLCHSLDLASRSEIISTVLRYFLFHFTQEIYNGHIKKAHKQAQGQQYIKSQVVPH